MRNSLIKSMRKKGLELKLDINAFAFTSQASL
jgi:hypothetical protein